MGAIKAFAGVADGKVTITTTETKTEQKTVKELKAELDALDVRQTQVNARHQASIDAIQLAKAEIRELIKEAKANGLKDE